MPATTDRTTAAEYVARLRASVDALYADRDRDAFTRRQFALWGAIEARGARFRDRVDALRRGEG